MGRRPRFCPPLLSNRCIETVAPRSSPPHAGGESCVGPEVTLSVVAACASLAGLPPPGPSINSPASSYTSATSSSPSFRIMQGRLSSQEGGQRSKKMKSTHATIPLLRSPLSRMLLSSRMRSTSPRMRSPSVHLGTSPLTSTTNRSYQSHDIDLNVELEQEEIQGNDENVQGNVEPYEASVEHCQIDLNAEPDGLSLEMEEVGVEPDQVNVARERNAHKGKEVPDHVRKVVFEALLARSKGGDLEGHDTREVGTQYSVHIRTVQRIWKDGKGCLDRGVPVDVSSKKSKRGRKKKHVDLSKLRGMSISSRTTLADMSNELGVSISKLHSMKREGVIERVSNSIKPFLTDKNKKERLKWCISMLDQRSIPHNPIFKDLLDFVFIDEKWFNITRKTERYYKTPDEPQPTRTCKNKNFIPKLMVLCAFARPRFDSQENCIFDGKIGCFPFVFYEAAKRSSKNRRAGTIEMKPLDSIKKGISREFFIDKVLPAIRAKWPREDMDKPIYIQQDNAPSHVSPNDKLFCEAAKQDGFDIRLVCQLANSPDFNILDLGFFSGIQSIQYKTSAKNTEELVAAVDEAFQDYSPSQANRIFLTLHGCFKEVMKIGGGNGYNVPHIRKGLLERQGNLPLQLNCEAELVQEAMNKLNE